MPQAKSSLFARRSGQKPGAWSLTGVARMMSEPYLFIHCRRALPLPDAGAADLS